MHRPTLMPVYGIITAVVCVVIGVLAYREGWSLPSTVRTPAGGDVVQAPVTNTDTATPTINLTEDELPKVGESITKDGYTITNEGVDTAVSAPVVDLTKIPTPAYTAVPWKPATMDKTSYDAVVAKLQPLIERVTKQIADNKQNGTQLLDTDAWLDIALYHNVLGDQAGAEALWLYLTKTSPGLVQPYGNLASMHMSRQEWDAAIPLYKKAISLMPKALQYYQDLADVYVAQKNTPAAIAILEEGSRADTASWSLLVTLGRLYAASGDATHARAAFEDAAARATKAGNAAAAEAIRAEMH